MDSPSLAIHIVLQDSTGLEQQGNKNLESPNKLHVTLSQPPGRNFNHAHRTQLPPNGHSLGMTENIASASASSSRNNNHAHLNDNKCKFNKFSQSTFLDCNNNASQDERADEAGMAPETPMRKLRKMGWYWGPISPEYASRLLEHEQDGSFLIRDSSSECYIFSMTLKLDGQVHHARIEHSSGHFSFGRSRKFLCTTIVDFIEQAIEYSHNGNLLFFLHRDPALEGPVRFRMIPLSRMKGLSSLKHMCRFAILPYVKRDKIVELSIPDCLRDYLNEPFIHNPEPLVMR